MKKLLTAIAAIGSLMALAGCEKTGHIPFNISAEAQQAFSAKYPSATNVEWENKNGYSVADFRSDNRDRSARVGSAQALVNKAQAAQSQARNEINKVVEVAWLKSNQALEQYRLSTSSIDLAKENVKLRERSFKEGLSTIDDVNDARNKLIAAQVAQRVAAYRFVVAYSLLHAASGTMLDFMDTFKRPDITVVEQ